MMMMMTMASARLGGWSQWVVVRGSGARARSAARKAARTARHSTAHSACTQRTQHSAARTAQRTSTSVTAVRSRSGTTAASSNHFQRVQTSKPRPRLPATDSVVCVVWFVCVAVFFWLRANNFLRGVLRRGGGGPAASASSEGGKSGDKGPAARLATHPLPPTHTHTHTHERKCARH